MKKYNILYQESLVPDSEIEKYMDFDKVVLGKDKFLANAAIRSYCKIGLLCLSVISVFFALYYAGSNSMTTSMQKRPPVATAKAPVDTKLEQVQDHLPTTTAVNQNAIVNKNSVLKDGMKKEPLQNAEAGAGTENFSEAVPTGGYPVLYEYFSDNLLYPEKARTDGITGTVLVEFVVNEIGRIEKIKVVKGLVPELDAEAKRLITQMPQWKPATINGKSVSTRLTLPLSFQLDAN